MREQVGDHATVMLTMATLLVARAELLRQRSVFDRRIISLARRDEVCKLLMTIPRVGPHVALSFRASVDDPARFRRSRNVGAHFGLTPPLQLGRNRPVGKISKDG
ncbi:transposase [Mesorhizobium sp. M0998]|uniref:transposase n=1 Tax=Mesorhizobium sp. M0998 TaxID=2957044 RepID=UPI003337D0A7